MTDLTPGEVDDHTAIQLAAERLTELNESSVINDPDLVRLAARLQDIADRMYEDVAAQPLRPDLDNSADVSAAGLVEFAALTAARFAELAPAGPLGGRARDAAILTRLHRLAGVHADVAVTAEGGWCVPAGLADVLTPPEPLHQLLRDAAETLRHLLAEGPGSDPLDDGVDLIERLRRAADIAEAADAEPDDDWVPVVPIQRGGISFASPAASGGAFPWERPDYSDPVVVMRAAANMLAGSVADLELADGSRFHPGNLPAHLHAAADALVEQRYADRFHRTRLQRQLDEVGRRLGARLRPLVDRLDGGPE